MVPDVVLELTGVIRLAKADFADGKSKTIPDIRGRLCSWGRTRVHQDAHELNRNRATAEAGGYIAARAVINHSLRKHSPIIVPVDMQMHRVVSGPILNPNLFGIGHPPLNADGVHRSYCAEIDYNPLRMSVVVLAVEVWI